MVRMPVAHDTLVLLVPQATGLSAAFAKLVNVEVAVTHRALDVVAPESSPLSVVPFYHDLVDVLFAFKTVVDGSDTGSTL